MDERTAPADLDLAAVFAALPHAAAVFAADAPRYTVLAASDALLALMQRPRDAVVGRPLAEAFSDSRPAHTQASGLEHLRASLAAAVRTGATQRSRQRYEGQHPEGGWQARHRDVVNIPVRGPGGAVRYVLHHVDVTTQGHEPLAAAQGEQRVDDAYRRRAEDALRESERRFRLLFENMGEGFALAEMIWHPDGSPADWRYLEVNDAWTQIGIPVNQTVGRRAREVNPEIEAYWIETYGRVVQTGQHVTYRNYARGFARWFDTVAFKHSDNKFGLIFRDATASMRAEEAIRQAASQAAYRLALTDALRAARDPAEAEAVAMQLLGEHLGASRVAYGEADPGSHEAFTHHREYGRDPATPPSLGRQCRDELGAHVAAALRAGRTLAVGEVRAHGGHSADDLAAYAAAGICAYLAVPLLRRGRMVAYLAVQHATPHAWTGEEIALAEETAERTWEAVERVRSEAALRASETQQAYLVRLGDALRPLASASEITGAVARLLGEELRANRAFYAEVDGDDWLIANPYEHEVEAQACGRHPLAQFGAWILDGFRAGTRLVICDLHADPRFDPAERAAHAAYRILGAVAVPLLREGGLVSILVVHSAVPRDWSGDEIALIEQTAERTWAAVGRARAEAALRASEARYRTLQQVSTELISEDEPGALYTKLVDAAIALMRADAGSLQVLERDGPLQLLASRNLEPQPALQWQRVSVEQASACSVASRPGERIIVADVETCAFMVGTSDLEAYRRLRLRAVQSTPLVARDGRAVGMLSTHWRQPHQPSGSELALFDVLAREAADLLDRMHAQTALRERADWLKGQGDALMAAINGASLHTSLAVLVRTATQTLGEEVRAAFYLADEDGRTLHHVVGMSAEYASTVDGFAIGPESLACGLATHSGDPVLTVDVQTDPRWEPWRWMAERFRYRACWSFPIHSRAGKLVGTLALYWPHPREASARELELAALLTNTAAIIISRHREAEVRQKAEEALRAALAEREALLRELHHRVKNNLQVITSLLEMQARKLRGSPALPLLTEARNRISAIGTIHELLYQSESLSRVDLLHYAERLIPHVVSLYERSAAIRISVSGDPITVDLARAVPFGLLLNEVVSNVCKHAFPASVGGELTVALRQHEGRMHLRVTDTGVGLPHDFDVRGSTTLGVQLVQMLAKQLGGTAEFRSTGGTTVDVHLPS